VPHTLNALVTVNGDPLIVKPVASTRSLSVLPAPSITVLHNPAVPTIEPMIVLLQPVVTAHPASQPKKLLRQLVVFEQPALKPIKVL